LPTALDSWNRALSKVDAAGSRIDKLGGEMQATVLGETIPRFNVLVTQLQGTSSQLNQLIDDLQRSPQMLLRGREAPQPGPGETKDMK
jgi:phospholipid/cholesterol/gamma-HCH transport system substrate-binding protein